jgi:hypothetical protein
MTIASYFFNSYSCLAFSYAAFFYSSILFYSAAFLAAIEFELTINLGFASTICFGFSKT